MKKIYVAFSIKSELLLGVFSSFKKIKNAMLEYAKEEDDAYLIHQVDYADTIDDLRENLEEAEIYIEETEVE